MSRRVDKILDVLDVGLQGSNEGGYGTDSHDDCCARCMTATPAEGGDMCAGCRAFLLGDTDDDPKARVVQWSAPFNPAWTAEHRLPTFWGRRGFVARLYIDGQHVETLQIAERASHIRRPVQITSRIWLSADPMAAALEFETYAFTGYWSDELRTLRYDRT